MARGETKNGKVKVKRSGAIAVRAEANPTATIDLETAMRTVYQAADSAWQVQPEGLKDASGRRDKVFHERIGGWTREQAYTRARGIVSAYRNRLRALSSVSTESEKHFGDDAILDHPEIRAAGRLSHDDQRVLVAAAQFGMKEAQDLFVKCNMPGVFNLARKYKWQGLTTQDLVQEGTFGLVRSAEIFDFNAGTRPFTLATQWIEMSMQRASDNKGATIRMPAHERELMRRVDKARATLENEGVEKPTLQQITDRANAGKAKQKLSADKVQDTLELLARKSVSMDEDFKNEEGSGRSLATKFADDSVDVSGDAINEDAKALVYELLDQVSEPKMRTVLEHKYGLAGHAPKTNKEISELTGMSTSSIATSLRKAESEMRKLFIERGVESGDDLVD